MVSPAWFVRVAQTRLITGAAQASPIALAAASRRMSLLEHQDGVSKICRHVLGDNGNQESTPPDASKTPRRKLIALQKTSGPTIQRRNHV